MVLFPHLTMLTHTFTTGHFRHESVVIPGGLQETAVQPVDRSLNKINTAQQEREGVSTAIQKNIKSSGQEAVHKPAPIQALQVGPGFKLRL